MALTEMMDSGKSWSGRERNCGFVNLGDSTFADASVALGLDFVDDGRGVVVTDWDGDGDLDLWLNNRTGPKLRFMRNDGVKPSTGQHFVAFKLTGSRCNRDAIGARVEVVAGGRRLLRTVVAGDGYLAQSSKWLHFGLGQAESIDRVTVAFPGGDREVFEVVAVDRRYRLRQGGDLVAEAARSIDPISAIALPPSKAPESARIVLRKPLPLPPTLTELLQGDRETEGPVLINFWAQWCAPCVAELSLLAGSGDAIVESGLQVVAVNVDEAENRDKAAETMAGLMKDSRLRIVSRTITPEAMSVLEAILLHVLDKKQGELKLPTSLLVDERNALQCVYLGPVTLPQLLRDAADYGRNRVKPPFRGANPGRWYFGVPRDLRGLATDLRERGRMQDAGYYVSLDATERLRKSRR